MGELPYLESGTPGRPSVVFLHGVGSNGLMWRSAMEGLPDFHCLAPDLPGHGASRGLPWSSRAETARQVAALIERHAAGGRADVVGLSLGGSVALELVAMAPHRLNHVIVDGCSALPSRVIRFMRTGVAVVAPFLRYAPVARVIGRAFGVQSGPALDDFVAQLQGVDPGSFTRAFSDANGVRLSAALLAAPPPTLLVAGERELHHVRASNALLATVMPHAEARMVPRSGHGWGPTAHPELHRRMIAAWLADEPLPPELLPETISIDNELGAMGGRSTAAPSTLMEE